MPVSGTDDRRLVLHVNRAGTQYGQGRATGGPVIEYAAEPLNPVGTGHAVVPVFLRVKVRVESPTATPPKS